MQTWSWSYRVDCDWSRLLVVGNGSELHCPLQITAQQAETVPHQAAKLVRKWRCHTENSPVQFLLGSQPELRCRDYTSQLHQRLCCSNGLCASRRKQHKRFRLKQLNWFSLYAGSTCFSRPLHSPYDLSAKQTPHPRQELRINLQLDIYNIWRYTRQTVPSLAPMDLKPG